MNRCDRILWATSKQVTCIAYNSVDDITFSDHKPVYGVFLVDIKRVSEGNRKPSPGFEQIAEEDVKHPIPHQEEPDLKIGTHESFDLVGMNGNVIYD